MDLPPVDGPVIVNTTIILIDIFEVFCYKQIHYLLKVHPETFTLDLSLYLKLMWKDNRIELANGSDQQQKIVKGGFPLSPNVYLWAKKLKYDQVGQCGPELHGTGVEA